MEKRVISTQVQEEDIKIEKSLRPQTLDDYIGQQKAKKNLKYILKLQNKEASRWITYFFMDLGTWKDDACGNHCK